MSKRPIFLGFWSKFAPLSLAVFALCGSASGFELIFGVGHPDIPDHFQSDGTTAIPKFAGYRFELGTFTDTETGPFLPTNSNTDEWLDYWVPIEDSSGDANPAGNVEYGEYATLFSTVTGLHSSFFLDHANPPFTAGTQMYIWGYDKRETPGAAQWVLMTNSTLWVLNDGASQTALGQTFHADDASGATTNDVGSVVGGVVTMGNVVIPNTTPPEVSIADTEASETGGSVGVVLTLSELSNNDVTVECSTIAGSAVSGQDYSLVEGTITVPAGQLSVVIDVTILNDGDDETDETFQIVLEDPVGVTLADPSALVTIRDDDALATLAEGGGLERDGISGDLSMTWPAVVGREYSVLFSHDLTNWLPVTGGETIVADSVSEQLTLPDTAVRCFYRVVDLAPEAP